MLGTEADPGVTSRSIGAVFQNIAQQPNRTFLLRATYIEIYNEVIRDLLMPGNENLKIHEDVINKRVFVDAKEVVVTSVEEVMYIIQTGETARAVGETNMNDRSSRSHTIFSLKIESREMSDMDEEAIQHQGLAIRTSTLSLVDLAGSERASFTKAQGLRLVEGGHINKSLLTLGTVINKLSSGESHSSLHIPYRDSKLTRLLQPALGGNARTAIICAVTPAILHMEETLSTLKFASRAKKVTNSATTNEFLDDRAKLRRAEKQIAKLKAALGKNGMSLRREGSRGSSGGEIELLPVADTCRVSAFEKLFEKYISAVSNGQGEGASASGLEHCSGEIVPPSLTYALDLPEKKKGVAIPSGTQPYSQLYEQEMSQMRQTLFSADKEKRTVMTEIAFERQAMKVEVDLLVGAVDEANRAQMTAERECEEAMGTLARAQASSLVDEIVSEAMSTSFLSTDLKKARRELVAMEDLQKELHSMKDVMGTLRKEHSDMVRRENRGIGPLLKELKNSKTKLVECETKLKGVRQAAQKSCSEQAAFNRETKERERKIRTLTAEVERRRMHSTKQQNRVKKEVAEEKKKLESSLKVTKEELNSLRLKVTQCEAKVSEKNDTVKELEEKLAEKLKENSDMVKELEEKLAEKLKETNELAKKSDSQRVEMEALQGKLHIADERMEDLQEQLLSVEEGKTAQEHCVEELEAAISDAMDNKSKLSEELERVYLDLEESRSEVAAVLEEKKNGENSEILKLQMACQQLEKGLSDEKRSTEAAVKEISTLTSILSERDGTIKALGETTARLGQTCSDVKQVNEALTVDLAAALQSKEEMQNRVSDMEMMQEDSQKETAMKLEAELMVVEETYMDKEEAYVKQYKSDIEALQRENDKLREQVFESQKDMNLVKKIEILEYENKLMKKQIDKMWSNVTASKTVQTQPGTSQHEDKGLEMKMENARKVGGNFWNTDGKDSMSENISLRSRVEDLLSETATRAREMKKLAETIKNRDLRIYSLEKDIAQIWRGEGKVATLESRLQRRNFMIGDLNRRLKSQQELFKKSGRCEELEKSERICSFETEIAELRELNEDLKGDNRTLENELEEVREETITLRNVIKDRDISRIDRLVSRKEAMYKETKRKNKILQERCQNQDRLV